MQIFEEKDRNRDLGKRQNNPRFKVLTKSHLIKETKQQQNCIGKRCSSEQDLFHFFIPTLLMKNTSEKAHAYQELEN